MTLQEQPQNAAHVMCKKLRPDMELQVVPCYDWARGESLVHTAIKSLIVAAAVLAAAFGAAAEPKNSPKPSTPPAQIPEIDALKGPMTFYLAKGAADACGSGCSEWIAAEGAIEEETADRMRAFLKRQTGPKRPIYFHSPGGLVSESLAIGRLMRERGLTAGVARTVVQGCEPKDCAEAKKAGREFKAKLNSYAGQCSSGCVYALVGARTREIAPEARLGIHAGRSRIKKAPKGVRIPPHFLADAHKESNRKIARYLVEMGIKPALLEAAEKIAHEDIRILDRDEIVRFGIDTRTFVEGNWFFDERAGVVKSISESPQGAADYHTTTLRFACLGTERTYVGYSRNLNPNDGALAALKLTIGGKSLRLDPVKSPVTGGDAKVLRDLRLQWVPAGFFELATANDYILITQEDANPRSTKVSTSGLAAALSSLPCAYPLRAAGERVSLTPFHLP
jgi:hypothetical protein